MKKLAIILIISLFAACEPFENPPNIVIRNSYIDGYLSVWNLDTEQNIVHEFMPLGGKKELHVPIGNYSVRLLIDCNKYLGEFDRIFFVYITSEYTFCEMTFRKE